MNDNVDTGDAANFPSESQAPSPIPPASPGPTPDATTPIEPTPAPSASITPPLHTSSDDSPEPLSEIEIPAELDREVEAALAAEMSSGATSQSIASSADVEYESGKELIGTVVNISDEDIFIEFGPKSQGVLPRGQFGKKEPLEPGRRIDVVVERYDNETGLLILNRKGAIQRATWNNLVKGAVIEGRATGVVKGGLELDIQGIRAFMPLSQISIIPMKDISVLLNQKIRCVVMEVNARKKNLLVSRRKILEIEAKEARENALRELEVGQTRKGIVRSLTEYGAFVDLGGIDGLLHVSDMSWSRITKPSDVVEVGQEIEVNVLKIDSDRDRISLSLKDTLPDPWSGVEERFPSGSSVKARIIRLANFGAFAEVESGVEGLIPISEMSWSRISTASEVVREGDMVDAVVIRVEPKLRRMALSIKQVQQDPWDQVFDSFPVKSLVKGKVTKLTDFGAFVEIVSGVEGLVHISELSQQHVKSCSEVVKEGEEIETRVIGVDKENRRISLSVKAVEVSESLDAPPETAEVGPPKPTKKRKKPLRGGLSSHYDW